MIVVDCGCASPALPGTPRHEEVDSIAPGRVLRLGSSIKTALFFAALAGRADGKVHLIVLDSTVRAYVSGVRGAGAIETLAHTFTDVSPCLDVTDWPEMVSAVEQTVHYSAFVIIATKIPPIGVETEFTDALARSGDRHTVLIASAIDPDGIRAWAGHGDAEQAFPAASVSLVKWSDEAGVTDTHLVGTLTVYTSAGLLSARTADRYTEFKRSGRP